jgi:hypothetical protein
MWNYDAINATIKAIRGAFHGGRFPNIRDFYIVSEPEACALYTIQDMINKSHDNVVPVSSIFVHWRISKVINVDGMLRAC